MASDIDKLEITVENKNTLVNYINQLEVDRNELTIEIAQLYKIDKPKKL